MMSETFTPQCVVCGRSLRPYDDRIWIMLVAIPEREDFTNIYFHGHCIQNGLRIYALCQPLHADSLPFTRIAEADDEASDAVTVRIGGQTMEEMRFNTFSHG